MTPRPLQVVEGPLSERARLACPSSIAGRRVSLGTHRARAQPQQPLEKHARMYIRTFSSHVLPRQMVNKVLSF